MSASASRVHHYEVLLRNIYTEEEIFTQKKNSLAIYLRHDATVYIWIKSMLRFYIHVFFSASGEAKG